MGLLAASILVLVSACGGGGMSESKPATIQQAAERGEQHIRELLGVLGPGGTLEKHTTNQGACLDDSNTKDSDQMQATADYWVRGFDPASYNEKFDTLKSWFDDNGWDIRNDDRPDDMFLNATSPDDYLVSLQANKKGGLSLGASSPCVQPNGTPESPQG